MTDPNGSMLRRFVSTDDHSVDSPGILLLVSLLVLIIQSVVAQCYSEHHEFNAMTFGGGVAALVGCFVGAGWAKVQVKRDGE